jgi:adenine/guanine phosphoribosyltransferase-like PRPP-binding protein
MVKWNPSGLEGQIKISFRNPYAGGSLYFNGIEKGDKLIIVEDLIDTGGTLTSLIKALEQNQIEVIDCLVIAEIVEMKGVQKIYEETGVMPKVALSVTRETGKFSKVIALNQQLRLLSEL